MKSDFYEQELTKIRKQLLGDSTQQSKIRTFFRVLCMVIIDFIIGAIVIVAIPLITIILFWFSFFLIVGVIVGITTHNWNTSYTSSIGFFLSTFLLSTSLLAFLFFKTSLRERYLHLYVTLWRIFVLLFKKID